MTNLGRVSDMGKLKTNNAIFLFISNLFSCIIQIYTQMFSLMNIGMAAS